MPARKRFASLVGSLLCLVLTALGPAALADGVKSTAYYNLHFASWESMANAMLPYVDAAFTAARDVLGYDNAGYAKIEVYFTSDANNWADGYYYAGQNVLYLNMAHFGAANDANAKSVDAILSHETSHLLFNHKTGGDESSSPWYDEALAYYVGNVAYPYGPQYTKAEIGASLSYYSHRGATKSGWFETGLRYDQGNSTDLDWWQLNALSFYLNSTGGWQGFQHTLTYLASGMSLESSLIATYGKPSGQYGSTTGPSANTLYSDYYYFYFGHY
jgi:hypothetical protein